MRRTAEIWSSESIRRLTTGATVVLFAAGSLLWMHHLRGVLAGEAAPGVEPTLPRLEGVMISADRRIGRLEGRWRDEGSDLSIDGVRWRLEQLDSGSAVLSHGGTRRRVVLVDRHEAAQADASLSR